MYESYSNLSHCLISGFHHGSGLALHDSYPNSCIHCAQFTLKNAPGLFSPYSSDYNGQLTNIIPKL